MPGIDLNRGLEAPHGFGDCEFCAQRCGRLGLLAAVLLAIVFCGGATQAQCMYEAVAIIEGPDCAPGDPAGFASWSMDENGNVVGLVACGITPTAALWTGGERALPLSSPTGAVESTAFDILNPDTIVGEARLAGEPHPFPAMWTNGVGTFLELPVNANTGFARAVNRDGLIVGGTSNTIFGPLQAVLWQNGSVQVLQLGASVDAQAFDINQHGQITGWLSEDFFTTNGFIWHNGVTTTLPVIPGGVSSRGAAINRFGRVAGFGILDDGAGGQTRHASFWDGSAMIDLGVLPGKNRSNACDLNDFDQIVGDASVGGSDNHAFVWQDGVMRQLDEIVIDDLGGVRLSQAVAIDNRGWILANTGNFGVLLRPVGSAPGDVDKNCIIDINDFLAVLTEWGVENSFADTDDDGTVGILDFLNVLANWG